MASLSGYSYLGCVADNSTRLFSSGENGIALMTQGTNSPSSCLDDCVNNGFSDPKYVGVEFGRNCFCANATSTLPEKFTSAPNRCTRSCPGETGAQCGGAFALNIYSLTATATSSPTAKASGGDSSFGKLSGGAIAGIVIGSAAGGGLVVLGFFMLLRRRRSAPKYVGASPSSPTSAASPNLRGSTDYQGSTACQETSNYQASVVTSPVEEAKPQEIPGDQQIYEMGNHPAPVEAPAEVHEMGTYR